MSDQIWYSFSIFCQQLLKIYIQFVYTSNYHNTQASSYGSAFGRLSSYFKSIDNMSSVNLSLLRAYYSSGSTFFIISSSSLSFFFLSASAFFFFSASFFFLAASYFAFSMSSLLSSLICESISLYAEIDKSVLSSEASLELVASPSVPNIAPSNALVAS